MFVSPQVVHKSVLDVAEEGTVAAAATGVNAVFRRRGMPTLRVLFNRPFLLLISNTDVQSTLFIGKLTNPK